MRLRGVVPVLSTPFTEDDEIDEVVLRREIEWVLSCGAHGVAVALVSEVLRLDDAERRTLTELVCAIVDDRVPVVASVGAESTTLMLRLARHAAGCGASAVMAIPPMAVALPDGALLAHFGALLDAVEVPVVVQDASGYLGRALSLPLYLDLLHRWGPERVLFKPEAEPLGQRVTALREASGGTARIFEGNAGVALADTHRRGVVGSMPGAEVPWAVVALWDALEHGDVDRADAVHGALGALVALQHGLDGFIALEKLLLVRQGVFDSDRRRAPVGYELDPATAAEARRLLDRLAVVCSRPRDRTR